MGKAQRRAERYNKNITIDLLLRDVGRDMRLAGPVPCFVVDLSSYGLGLILNQVHFQGHHFFYEPQDNSDNQLYIEREGEKDGEVLTIPVRPVWFNLDDDEELRCFHMGVEFQAPPNDKRIALLKRIAAGKMGEEGGWLNRLLLKLWT